MAFNYLNSLLLNQNLLNDDCPPTGSLLLSHQMLSHAWKFQNSFEQSLIQSHLKQIIAVRNQLMCQAMSKILTESHLQPCHLDLRSSDSTVSPRSSLVFSKNSSLDTSSSLTLSPINQISKEKNFAIQQETQDFTIKLEPSLENQSKNELKDKLKDMLIFLTQNIGKTSNDKIQQEREKYQGDKRLVQVFDILAKKYSGASKSREEMIKYILRKAFRAVRNTIQQKMRIDYKEASKVLCKRYFKESANENDLYENKEKEGDEEDEDEESFFKAMLPFRKNSKNKTMNANFLNELFSSDQFCEDYNIYLNQIDDILQNDNMRKIQIFLGTLENRIQKNQIEAIRQCKRMPWLQVWLDSTKKLAFELVSTKEVLENRKKVNYSPEEKDN